MLLKILMMLLMVHGAAAQSTVSQPFLQFDGFTDGTWFVFFIVSIASSRLGMLFTKIGLPSITGYMIIGCLCGPYILNIVSTSEIPELSYVTQVALSFIAFSAGSELYLPELRSLFRSILWISLFLAIVTYFLCTVVVYLLAVSGVLPWAESFSNTCTIGIGLIAAAIMTARSPASAIAVIRELRAKGPVTGIMLGVTVFGDVVVLVLFTLSTSIAQTMCAGTGFEGGAFMITILTLIGAVGVGYALGAFLIFLLYFPRIGKYLVIPTGFITFIACSWFSTYSFIQWSVSINFDALLVCITAGYVVTNNSANRLAFLQLFSAAGPYIFIPFFTKVGVELNLVVLLETFGFAFVVFATRALCVFAGVWIGGSIVGLETHKKKWMWITMLAQAGVSLGLASEVAVTFPSFGSQFQATIVGVVLINQFIGPVACKIGLKKSGEAGLDDGEHEDEDTVFMRIKRAIIVGADETSLIVAQRLINKHWGVVIYDSNAENLDLTSKLIIPKETHTDKHANLLHADIDNIASDVHNVDEVPLDANTDMKPPINDQPAYQAIGGVSSIPLAPVAMQSDVYVHVDESDNTYRENTYRSKQKKLRKARNKDIIITRLIPADTDVTVYIDRTLTELGLDAPDNNLRSAIVYCSGDADSYGAATLLVDKLHVSNVVARLHNPEWAEIFRDHGISPVFDLSTNSQLLFSAVTTNDSASFDFISFARTVPDMLFNLIRTANDWTFQLSLMSPVSRKRFKEQYPSPTPTDIRNAADKLKEGMAVDLQATLPVAHNEILRNSIGMMNNIEASGSISDDFSTARSDLIWQGPTAKAELDAERQRQAEKTS